MDVTKRKEIREKIEVADKNVRCHFLRSRFSFLWYSELPLFLVLPILLIAVVSFLPNLHGQSSQPSAVPAPAHDLAGVWMPFPDKKENGEPVISGIEEKT